MDIFNVSVLFFVPFKKGIVPFLRKKKIKIKIKINKERKKERKKKRITAKKKKN